MEIENTFGGYIKWLLWRYIQLLQERKLVLQKPSNPRAPSCPVQIRILAFGCGAGGGTNKESNVKHMSSLRMLPR